MNSRRRKSSISLPLCASPGAEWPHRLPIGLAGGPPHDQLIMGLADSVLGPDLKCSESMVQQPRVGPHPTAQQEPVALRDCDHLPERRCRADAFSRRASVCTVAVKAAPDMLPRS